MIVPMMKGPATPKKAICRSMRAPYMRRVSTSRPKLSVPSEIVGARRQQRVREIDGDRDRRRRRQGPNSAMRSQPATIAAPTSSDAGSWSRHETAARAAASLLDAHSFTRGSSATVTISTMKLVRTTPRAKNRVTPWTMK